MAAARLVRLGHPAGAVLHYTPRQMAAWLHFGEIDRRQAMADHLVIGMNAARGDLKDVQKQVEDLRE
ncbi:hypothetical protein LB543_01405 [Mesorhizobium sp. ESP7-2]|uniref:hypothetical protein n=1 Tax=Mesorhizobium sp. ESP7-2 TaxID=2876622 RepID=UPI001CCA0B4A|nr:hypothetical protein [Mesorhizobium sp. ESP7-2]MBZ9705385.1 hypothetical protein [Mesorhizobium sp. ESP7-2]